MIFARNVSLRSRWLCGHRANYFTIEKLKNLRIKVTKNLLWCCSKNAWPCSRWLRWHHVNVVNDYADYADTTMTTVCANLEQLKRTVSQNIVLGCVYIHIQNQIVELCNWISLQKNEKVRKTVLACSCGAQGESFAYMYY